MWGARLLYERESRIVIEYDGLDDELTDVSVTIIKYINCYGYNAIVEWF